MIAPRSIHRDPAMEPQDPSLNRQEGEYIELDYRDLEAFILGELNPRDHYSKDINLRDLNPTKEFAREFLPLPRDTVFHRDSEFQPELFRDSGPGGRGDGKDYSQDILVKDYVKDMEPLLRHISAEPLVKNYLLDSSVKNYSLEPSVKDYSLKDVGNHIKTYTLDEIDGLNMNRSILQSAGYSEKDYTVREITVQPLTVSVIKDTREERDRIRDETLAVDEGEVRKALGLQQQECSIPLSLPPDEWISQPESIPNSYSQTIQSYGLGPETVPNLGLDGIGLNLTNDSSIYLNDYRHENLQRSFAPEAEELSIRGTTVSSLVSIGTINSESINSKLSAVNFDTESTGSVAESSGSCGGGGGGGGRKSRDEKIIQELGIPFTAERIINCSMDDFNSMLVSNNLTEDQINTSRDIRRRGKNKIAAQNCRKRKVDQITNLAEEVEEVRERKNRIIRERMELGRSLETWQARLDRLERFILTKLNRDESCWKIEFIGDNISLVPKVSSDISHIFQDY